MSIALTDRSYTVLRLARRQADVRSAEHVATRDILDGLWLEGSGVAAIVMHALRLPFPKSSVAASPVHSRSGSPEPRIGPGSLVGEAHKLWIRAESEAANCIKQWSDPPLREAWLGTEHWLLGITSGNDESGTVILRERLAAIGLTLTDVRTRVLELIFGASRGS